MKRDRKRFGVKIKIMKLGKNKSKIRIMKSGKVMITKNR